MAEIYFGPSVSAGKIFTKSAPSSYDVCALGRRERAGEDRLARAAAPGDDVGLEHRGDDVLRARADGGLGGFFVEHAADADENVAAENAAHLRDDMQRVEAWSWSPRCRKRRRRSARGLASMSCSELSARMIATTPDLRSPSMISSLFMTLSLHATGAVASQERFDFGQADEIEVAADRMLQAARGHGELDRVLRRFLFAQRVDQPRPPNESPPPTRSTIWMS